MDTVVVGDEISQSRRSRGNAQHADCSNRYCRNRKNLPHNAPPKKENTMNPPKAFHSPSQNTKAFHAINHLLGRFRTRAIGCRRRAVRGGGHRRFARRKVARRRESPRAERPPVGRLVRSEEVAAVSLVPRRPAGKPHHRPGDPRKRRHVHVNRSTSPCFCARGGRRLHIPQIDRCVHASRSQRFAIRTVGDRQDTSRMPRESAGVLAAGHLP